MRDYLLSVVLVLAAAISSAFAAEPTNEGLPVSNALPTKQADVALAIVQCNRLVVAYLIVDGEVYVYDARSTVSYQAVQQAVMAAKTGEARTVECIG